MVPKRTGTAQLVVIVIGVLPVAVPLRTRAKFTFPGAAVIVTELFSVALMLTAAALDLFARAAGNGSRTTAATRNRNTNPHWKTENLPRTPFSSPMGELDGQSLSFASRKSPGTGLPSPHTQMGCPRMKNAVGTNQDLPARPPRPAATIGEVFLAAIEVLPNRTGPLGGLRLDIEYAGIRRRGQGQKGRC